MQPRFSWPRTRSRRHFPLLLADASSFSFSCTVLYVRGFGDTGILFKTHAYSSSARGVPIWKARTSHQPLAPLLALCQCHFQLSKPLSSASNPADCPYHISRVVPRPFPLTRQLAQRKVPFVRTKSRPGLAHLLRHHRQVIRYRLSRLFPPSPIFALCCVPLAFSPLSQPFPPFRSYKL
jgi:hypothetical protein